MFGAGLKIKKVTWQPVRWLEISEVWLNYGANLAIFIIMVVTVADVFMRYIFNSPVRGAYELSETMMVGAVFLALAYTQKQKGHVSVQIFSSRLPAKAQTLLATIILFLSFGVFVLITWQGGRMAWEALIIGDYTEGTVEWPLWPGRAVVAVGAGLLCLRLMFGFLNKVHHLLIMRPVHRAEGGDADGS